jgi:TatD DNase family protein
VNIGHSNIYEALNQAGTGLVDSHCHVDHAQFNADREAVIERALAAGVTCLMAIGTGDGPPDLEAGIRLAERHACFYATVGVHPHDAAKATLETFVKLRELIRHPKALAVGEIGLDYHYDFSPRDVQRTVFRTQLEIAAEAGKPIVIHTREAWADTMSILHSSLAVGQDTRPVHARNSQTTAEVGQASWPVRTLDSHVTGDLQAPESGPHAAPSVARAGVRGEDAFPTSPGIMHCFTGDEEQAREALALGFHLAFGGVLTFPKAEALRQAARIAPEERILLETDCPYLAPVPHRGKRNEPAFLVETARKLAQVRGVSLEHLADVTTRNFERLCLRRQAGNGKLVGSS